VTPSTLAQFDQFLTDFGYTVAENKDVLLKRSFSFLSTVKLCKPVPDEIIVQAHNYIAYSMSAEGGGFNPFGVAEEKMLTKKGLGRGAIVKEWDVDKSLSGSDSISKIKRLGVVYELLKDYLCGSNNSIIELIR